MHLGSQSNVRFQVEVFWFVTPCSIVVGWRQHGPPKRRYPTTRHYSPENLELSYQRRENLEASWRQHGPPKRRYPPTTLNGVTTQKTSTWNIRAVKASKLAKVQMNVLNGWSTNINVLPVRVRGLGGGGSRVVLDAVVKIRIPASVDNRISDVQSAAQSLYWLSYRSSNWST
jgi:hypothetical protein